MSGNASSFCAKGKETEPRYFTGLKLEKGKENHLTALRIEIYDTDINTGKELVQLAKELKETAITDNNPYDSIWIVIDRDGYTKHPHAFNQAQANEIKIAFSSISFEYWFLLHFAKTSKPFRKADELIKYLRDEGYYPDYEKNRDHYTRLRNLTSNAIKNAAWLRNHICYDVSKGDKCYDLYAYTDVDMLVSYLLKL